MTKTTPQLTLTQFMQHNQHLTLRQCLIKYSQLQKQFITQNKQKNIDIINKAIDKEIQKLRQWQQQQQEKKKNNYNQNGKVQNNMFAKKGNKQAINNFGTNSNSSSQNQISNNNNQNQNQNSNNYQIQI